MLCCEIPLWLHCRYVSHPCVADTRAERNALMERVYPGLKAFCQRRGFEFQVVDMRWGVRDEATDDHMTSELCMKELSNCQKLSTGPNFIVSAVFCLGTSSPAEGSHC